MLHPGLLLQGPELKLGLWGMIHHLSSKIRKNPLIRYRGVRQAISKVFRQGPAPFWLTETGQNSKAVPLVQQSSSLVAKVNRTNGTNERTN
jgi:hypothetical protein